MYAAVDADDVDHARCVAAMRQPGLRLVIPAMVVAEATYLIGTRMGPSVEAGFLRSLRGFRIEPPRPEDLDRMSILVEEYGDFPLGGTDAAVIALAERLGTDRVLSLDRRHMLAVRLKSGGTLRLSPD
ncbi:MAG: type II toxin-antitoxin system VapC family toxin [Myxococcota bacterium]